MTLALTAVSLLALGIATAAVIQARQWRHQARSWWRLYRQLVDECNDNYDEALVDWWNGLTEEPPRP